LAPDKLDRLLPGEDPRTELAEDVAHWILVYLELMSTKHLMIEQFHQVVLGHSREVREELIRDDLRALEAELRRFQRRLAYWQQRQLELDGDLHPK
jgi:hypothetical protein